jgi:hypothetical protein
MKVVVAIPNRGLLRLTGLWVLLGLFLFELDFLLVAHIGVTPGGSRFGSPEFWRNVYITIGILVPVTVALFVCGQGLRAPRILQVEPGGLSYRSLRWVDRRLRPVRVEIRIANIARVRNYGLGLYMVQGRSVLTYANGTSSPLSRDSLCLDRRTVDHFCLKPEPYRLV